jgi:acetyl esterase/lipase
MCTSLVACFAAALALGAAEPIPLWPHGAPDDPGPHGAEGDLSKPGDRQVADRHVTRLGNVSVPTLTVFRPPESSATGAAVVVCPGGGYNILAIDLEGTEVCAWLNTLGVTGVLLKYRVPERRGDAAHRLPLQDAQRALRLVRLHAREWRLDPRRIGVMGFSAGGHLAANLSNNYAAPAYAPVDEADALSARPDFALPVYPAYLVRKNQPAELAPELGVTSNTPPTLLVQTEDDHIRVENSVTYFLALKRAGVPAAMHLYPEGGHGYGLRPTSSLVGTWPQRAAEWLGSLGVLEPAGAAARATP